MYFFVCELEAGCREGVGVMEATCAAEQLFAWTSAIPEHIRVAACSVCVQLCGFIGLCRSDTSGKHQIFCVHAVWLPSLCTVSSMYLKIICSLCMYQAYKVLDLLSVGHAVYSHAFHLGNPSHAYRSLSFSSCLFSLRYGFYLMQVLQ